MSAAENKSSNPAPDRAVFVTYFVGAVVPVMVLSILVDRYLLSAFAKPPDHFEVATLIGLLASIPVLLLFCYFKLRRLTRHWLESMQRRNRELAEALREKDLLAYHDSLTGLPNRRRYLDLMEKALLWARRSHKTVAICFLDLDGFKRINDTLGHSAGDEVLCAVAERLLKSLRHSDAIARFPREEPDLDDTKAGVSRLGGDEFTFLLQGISEARDAAAACWRVLEALRAPFVVNGHEVFANGSIGIAMHPSDGEDAEVLIRNADVAMYHAKSCGRNNYQFYTASMNINSERRLDLERRLRRALENQRFTLLFQPIRDAVTGRTNAAEALLRWEDPEVGPVSPAEFIPIAEETGLIVDIGEWVLRTACGQYRAWRAEGLGAIRIDVNVSGHQIRQPSFVAKVARVLEETGVSASHLELEITESTIMQEDDVTSEAFQALDDMGVGIALDDFGTGYSSLSYLKRFPIDRVKIDRSFVSQVTSNSDDRAITNAIIAMAHSLRLRVVAEGVETREQADFLRARNCDELQGYLFSRPVPASDFTHLLEREKVE